MHRLIVLGVAAASLLSIITAAQNQPLAFEVASVKENTNNGPSNFVPQRSGDLIIMHNTRLFAIFNYAYRLTETYQMEGYDRFQEGWKWYDIEARARGGATDDQVRLMFQSLLADRFKVRVHRETKEIPGFELVTDKGKSKLTRTSSEGPMKATIEGIPVSQAAGTCGGSMLHEGVRMICHAVSMNTIAPQFSAQMHAPVVDHTGLTGTYDLDILFLPEERRLDPNAPLTPSFEQALQEELGLKLQKGKGPVEILVIDSVSKPSEN